MSISAAENAGPGPGELQDPLWVKMNAITGGITKKRKKSDAKPQSQINKCLNEKKRRTQENLYIDELAELISATDMSSGKTDKCQILQRTVDQIRHIRQQQGTNSHAVQQGEVSSSNPGIPPSEHAGTTLLEALDGFLFVVNTEGRVEHVTDNIQQFLNYTQDDVLGKVIYNIIHHGDHQSFMPNLLPIPLGLPNVDPQPLVRNRVFNCRFLVKPPDDKDETMEEKQQRVFKYETMQISAALLPNTGDHLESGDVSSESSDIGPCVLCVARRMPTNEKPPNTATVQQFTVKLDTTGRVLAIDTSWLTTSYSQYLNKEVIGGTIQDLCHPHDLSKVTAHLKETIQIGEGTSSIYRLRINPDTFVNVQTKSKIFKANALNGHDADFIMSTNSVIGDNDLASNEGGQLSNSKVCSGHSSNNSANNSINNNGNNNNNVGGPLMSVVHVNGQVSAISGRTMSNTSGQFMSDNSLITQNSSTTNPFHQFTSNDDLEFDIFENSPWNLDSSSCADRPESRNTVPSNSRPPSQPNPTSPSPQSTYTSSSAVAVSHCSPLQAYSPSSMMGAHTFSNTFPFSPLQESSSIIGGVINGKDTIGGTSTPSGQSSTASLSAPSTPPITSCTTINVTSGTSSSTTASTQSTTMTSSAVIPATIPTTNLMTTVDNSSLGSGDSGRLRNLLTKGVSASSDEAQDIGNNESGMQNQNNRILKTLLNQQDDEEYPCENPVKLRSSPSGQSKSNAELSKSTLGNHMLLQLLNERNDEDDDTRAGLKQQTELLQQLLKNPDEERKMQDSNRESDSLLRSLGFQSATSSSSQSVDHGHHGPSQIGQKRPNEDSDINVATKRTMDNSHQVSSSGSTTASNNSPSRLWEKNKMLASLLAKQPSQPATIPPIPASVISATPQDKLPQVSDRLKQQQHPQQQPWTASGMPQSIGSTATTTIATSARTPLQNPSRQLPRQSTSIYLSHMLSHERPQMGQMDSEFASSGDFTGNDASNTWNNQTNDRTPDDILDLVINLDPEGKPIPINESTISQNMLNAIEIPQNNLQSVDKEAIDTIQKFLMGYENEKANATSSTLTMSSTPPAYSTALGNAMSVTTAHQYQAPPMYQQQRPRFANQSGIRQTTTPFTPQQQAQQQQQQLLHHQQRSKLIHQQQLKQRLLQQQQQQQLLIPSNATAPDQIATGIHNIDSLLNNTVAPNVSLQRSSVSDSQMSPGYGGSVQLSATHRLQHSYSHPATITQHPVTNNFNSGQQVSGSSRLSPHSPVGLLSFSHPQPLSPRVSQGNYGNSPRMFNVSQTRAQQQPANQQLQQQRSMPSPGTAVPARQSPYPAEAFPPPASPTASQFPPVQNQPGGNPTGQYRLQRATSTPTATTQLPGGVGSPRHYGSVKDQQSMLSPSHQRAGCPQTSSHNVPNNQHFNQQHSSMIYRNSGSNVNTPDVQSNQFCYDQGSVPVYSSGGEDNRSMSSSNPGNHQMGGTNNAGMTSEFVRQELRAVVGARTQQRVPSNIQNNLIGQVSQDDLEALGLSFEMSPAGEAVVSDGPAKSWAIGSAGSAPSSSRNTMEEAVRGDPKSSLLQKLLSE
ncbi:nuclear receptor coactivator 2 isoform X2 [Diachasmimorpha longicaudata]|uniref:nuclear receptor coactivator 2 isoform X2 n=1 Tax=Diachasmimorpha longicaudata TaxID=58733 RepID=UPI0030B91059